MHLWQMDGATAREITDAARAEHDWSMGTVKTFLQRLTEKGWVEVGEKLRYGERKFVAKVGRAEAVAWLCAGFFRRWASDRESVEVVREALVRHEKRLDP